MTLWLILCVAVVLVFIYLNMVRIRLDEEVAEIKKKQEEKERSGCKSSTEYFEQGLAYYQKSKYEEAYECFSMAERMNHIGAKHHLGCMYLKGLGVKRDEKRGYELIEEAAGWGYAPAQEMLTFKRAMWDVLPKGEWEIDFS